MKVILLEDIDNLGRLGDTITVKAGYARNYLIPRKLALQATAQNLKTQQNQIQALERRKDQVIEDAKSLSEKLAGVMLSFTRKCGAKGQLFGSVTNMDIADALAESGLTVDRRDVVLVEPIKSLGDFDVTIKLHHDVAPVVKVTVLPEDGIIPESVIEEGAEAPAVTEEPTGEPATDLSADTSADTSAEASAKEETSAKEEASAKAEETAAEPSPSPAESGIEGETFSEEADDEATETGTEADPETDKDTE